LQPRSTGQATLSANYKVSSTNIELCVISRSLTNQCLANTPSNSSDTFSWVASCDPDCDSPYELHIVNSRGTAQEVTQEGFWSDYFWIRPSSRPKSESTSSLVTSTAPSTTSAQALPTPAPSTMPASETVSTLPSPTETGSSSSGLSLGVKIGLGIGAVAIVLCTIGLGALCCVMKKRGKQVLRDTRPHASYEGDKAGLPTYFATTSREQDDMAPHHTYPQFGSGQKVIALDTIQPMNHAPTELAATHSPSELGTARWR
jgi:hypothetical protein